jgi:peptidyl-prolyl cis-trans isomerase C
MRITVRLGLVSAVLINFVSTAVAQQSVQGTLPPNVAATVNGQPIPESAVQRGIRGVKPEKRVEARQQVISDQIDMVVVDQYLQQLNIAVDKKEIDDAWKRMEAGLKAEGQTVEKFFTEQLLTEDEMRAHMVADLRWDKFAGSQASEKVLRDLFEHNKDMFDGSMVRARHILLAPAAGDPTALERAKAQLLLCKRTIEDEVQKEMAKLPPNTDTLVREQARILTLEREFAKKAAEISICPSKKQGGDVGWFSRAGSESTVEPFAKAAFALKPYAMSDVVTTKYGCHLILATERKPGVEPKFEDVQAEVKDVYCERLRDAILAKYRPSAKIVIAPRQ